MGREKYPTQPFVPASRHPQGLTTDQLSLVPGGAQEVEILWRGNVWFCPFCEEEMRPSETTILGKPPRYAHMLYDIIRHDKRKGSGQTHGCGMSFAPKMRATVVRR